MKRFLPNNRSMSTGDERTHSKNVRYGSQTFDHSLSKASNQDWTPLDEKPPTNNVDPFRGNKSNMHFPPPVMPPRPPPMFLGRPPQHLDISTNRHPHLTGNVRMPPHIQMAPQSTGRNMVDSNRLHLATNEQRGIHCNTARETSTNLAMGTQMAPHQNEGYQFQGNFIRASGSRENFNVPRINTSTFSNVNQNPQYVPLHSFAPRHTESNHMIHRNTAPMPLPNPPLRLPNSNHSDQNSNFKSMEPNQQDLNNRIPPINQFVLNRPRLLDPPRVLNPPHVLNPPRVLNPPLPPVAVLPPPMIGVPPTFISPQTMNPMINISVNRDVKDLKEEYKETMKGIVKKWILSRNSIGVTKPNKDRLLKIHQFKNHLQTFVGLIEKLRHLNDTLAEHMAADANVWHDLMKDVTATKKEVMKLQCKLFNSEQMNFITKSQKNRKKKRERIKRRKKERSEKYVSSLSNRIKLNEEFDESLQKQRTKLTMQKRVESLRNVAGESLIEVKRKQTEVSEFIDVFNLLKELREIRKKTAIYQGIFVTEKEDQKFNSKIDFVSKLLTSNENVYENEECALRELREEEAQEMNRVEKEKRKKRKENRQEQLTQVDPMFPFRLYWLQGEESYASLIHVRRMWDIFISPPHTPGGSRIPKSFIEPSEPCNKEWGKYLVKQPKVRKRRSELALFLSRHTDE